MTAMVCGSAPGPAACSQQICCRARVACMLRAHIVVVVVVTL